LSSSSWVIPTTVAPNFLATRPASTVSAVFPPRDEITTIEFSPTHDGVSCTNSLEDV